MNGQSEYEYKILDIRGDESHLNLVGLSGWKLVFVLPADDANSLPRHYFIRERVPDERPTPLPELASK